MIEESFYLGVLWVTDAAKWRAHCTALHRSLSGGESRRAGEDWLELFRAQGIPVIAE